MGKILDFTNNKKVRYEELVDSFKFGLHKHEIITEFGMVRTFYFIALKDKQTGIVLQLTPYSKYLRFTYKNIDTRRPETIRAKGLYICQFLNYVFFEKYSLFKITKIEDITINHGNKFINDYANGLTGRKVKNSDGSPKIKNRATINQAMMELGSFFTFIQKEYGINAKNIFNEKIFTTVTRLNPKTKKVEDYKKPCFLINLNEYPSETVQLRNIPTGAVAILFKLCDIYYPEIKLALALQAFGGLRAGEVCNCRQEISPYGGTKLTRMGSKLIHFELDLRRKLVMRSDHVDVGNIKTPGKQAIYEPFLDVFDDIYIKHMKWLKKQPFEPEYAPLFLTEEGMAMTYKSYKDKFQRLANTHLKEALLKSEDTELQDFGKQLNQYKLSTHALRHWYTVQLVLDGLSATEIATRRRDSSLDSATSYIARKTELIRVYSKANDELFNKMKSTFKNYNI